ncbi:MAG: DUF3417 domain-containing protein, partial [Actinobacteria bacterium]|nr:DUF3417 domain-containing protein [Actinomycetota bacterium]
VTAAVSLGTLSPSDVEVQLVHGPVGDNTEIDEPTVAPMVPEGTSGDGRRVYRATFACTRAGRYGWAVRIVPAHPDLRTWTEVGCVTNA